MVALSWSCEGANGTTVTTANSGLDFVGVGTGATMQYNTANALFGTSCVAVTNGTTAAATECGWSTQLGTVTTLYGRWYLKLGATPSAALRLFQGFCSGSQSGFGADVTTTRTLQTKNASNGSWGTSVAIPLNQWVRIEMDAPAFSTMANVTMRVYLSPHSTTADSTLSGTLQNIGTSCNFFRLPIRGASYGPVYYDEVKLDTAGQPGPLPDPTVTARGQFFPFLA